MPEIVVKKSKPDYILLFIVFALISIGFIMVASAGATMGMRFGDAYYYLKRHSLHLIIGLFALIAGLRTDLSFLRKWSLYILIGAFLLLLLTFIPGIGRSVGGASRWVDAGLFSFEPSEIVKFSVVLFLASSIASAQLKTKDFVSELIPTLFIIALVSAIILKQPDLGTTIIIIGVSFVMLFIGGAPGLHLIVLGTIVFFAIFLLSIVSPYRFRRLLAFINPWKDPYGIGFHIIQALLAVGSGGFLGLGLGGSKQKFFYLPQHYTDSIFAILCEELGLLGGASVIALYLLFLVRGFKIARNAPPPFYSLLAVGITTTIVLQAAINLGVVLSLIPATGIPLPLISFGGTSLIMTLYSIGVLLNIGRYRVALEEENL